MAQECSCIRGNFNFYVEALDKETIIYQDLSDWMDEENYEDPVSYDVTIIPPTKTKGVTLSLLVGSTNRLTSQELGCFLDGIYCFKVTSCGVEYIRSKAIFPYLECCVKQAWATLYEQFEDQIREVEKHLKLAKINAEHNNVKLASKNLAVAKKLLENIKCDCNC